MAINELILAFLTLDLLNYAMDTTPRTVKARALIFVPGH